jgi:hypothetical protein
MIPPDEMLGLRVPDSDLLDAALRLAMTAIEVARGAGCMSSHDLDRAIADANNALQVIVYRAAEMRGEP